MSTEVVLLTRDLRLHDQPALAAACARARRVAVLFVLDEALLVSPGAAPNRLAFLLDALADLDRGLRERAGALIVRRGRLEEEVAEVVRTVRADRLHVARDVTPYARHRETRLARVADETGCRLEVHPGPAVVEPEDLRTQAGGAYHVFGPYWRRWSQAATREIVPAPRQVVLPDGLEPGRLPDLVTLAGGPLSPDLATGGETEGRRRLDAWLDGGIEDYEQGRDRLGDDATSHLSAHLRFGCVSASEVVSRLDRRRRGHEAYLRQLCWRDFALQLQAEHPDLGQRDLRPRRAGWHDDPEGADAWREGRTGYPVVDAAMRQLRAQGWMPNRARMLVASFLTKHLLVDWRIGARHFLDWLVDGDPAINAAQWQWVAGTGTDSRPGRMLNPLLQSRRHDPRGVYLRRHLPELRGLSDDDVHDPAEAPQGPPSAYPRPLVDHAEARARFLAGA
jgi:deoxyribodipyrimidine photo-lyase